MTESKKIPFAMSGSVSMKPQSQILKERQERRAKRLEKLKLDQAYLRGKLDS